jgi:hypothetical protein
MLPELGIFASRQGVQRIKLFAGLWLLQTTVFSSHRVGVAALRATNPRIFLSGLCLRQQNSSHAEERIDVTGDFNTLLRIEDSQKNELVQNDAVNALAANLNARLVFVPAKDDSYRLIVTSFKAGVAGKYTLKVQDVARVGKEEVIKGELTGKDEKYQDAFAHKHKIQMEAGQPYTIELDNAQYDTRLVLFDPTGKIIAAQNDGISPSNLRLARIDFTPQMTAAYVILVTSYDPGKTGPYRLRVQGYGSAPGKK